ncbi:MAG: outer-membrane lipoprotein carrier protein LolA [Candidatus Adiutrix sp.]|jgi:outer membrane lipoprotein carrier protein|nr:outer-membrane lipoprotein carrier protein LolA [Candidatus Adiutrix sp.]
MIMTDIRIKTAALAFLALAVLSSGAAAAAPGQAEALAGLSARYQNLTSLRAAYIRVASTPSSEQLFKSGSSQTAAGLLSWSRPSKLLLAQASPQPETLVTDGATVWWHIPAEKIAFRYKNIDVASQLKPLLSFLAGLDSLEAAFKVGPAPAGPNRPGQYGLTLSPKEADGGTFEQLTVWCDQDFSLTGFRLASATGETTDFTLSALEENPKLDDSIFTFKPPRGTEVIDDDEGQ